MNDLQDRLKDALDLLDLPTLITKDDIKKRYRQLASKYHPDINSGDGEKMEQINRAYELLMHYIDEFRYSFDSVEIDKQHPGEAYVKNFRV